MNLSDTPAIFSDDDTAVDRAMQLAVRDALREHKRKGEHIAIWQDGKVVIVPPDEIVVPDVDQEDALTAPPAAPAPMHQ